MTKKELDKAEARVELLSNRAIGFYLDKTDFNLQDWLSKKDAEEYRVLLEKIETHYSKDTGSLYIDEDILELA